MTAVYFLKAIEAGWIKIGYSKRPIDRVADCQHVLSARAQAPQGESVTSSMHGTDGSPPPDPEHAERVLEGTSARKLRGHRMRALEDRARRDDASAWAILQGSVRRHRETIGVLIHRLIDARVSLSNEEEEVGDTLRLPDPRAEGRRNQAPARSTARAGARPPPPRHR
jgi:hypothetical protein